MRTIAKIFRDSKTLLVIFVSMLVLSLHYAFVVYINSSFLSLYVPENLIGLLYTAGAIINISFLFRIPHYLKIYGNYLTILSAILLEMVALGGMAFSDSLPVIIFSFIIHQAVVSIILVCLDEFLEKFSRDDKMGAIRGTYLTFSNIAYVAAPFIVGQILDDGNYWKIYMLSFVLLIPLYLLLRTHFKKFKDSRYEEMNVIKTTEEMAERKDVFFVYLAAFLLQFFYAWMVIYMPLYLHENLGFEWSKIGMIFSVMLLPFVIFELPVGRMEDKRMDEREILVAGFVIAGISTSLIPFVGVTGSALVWATVLFMTRVGASLIEVTTEKYFFSHVKTKDSNLISLFRINTPLSYIIAPLVASSSIYFLNIQSSFFVLGFVMLGGALTALGINKLKIKNAKLKVAESSLSFPRKRESSI